jgi:hypothetical protein
MGRIKRDRMAGGDIQEGYNGEVFRLFLVRFTISNLRILGGIK